VKSMRVAPFASFNCNEIESIVRKIQRPESNFGPPECTGMTLNMGSYYANVSGMDRFNSIDSLLLRPQTTVQPF
jgi:hypothetical protein